MLSRKYFDRSGPPVLHCVRHCVRRWVGLGVASWAVVAALALPTDAQEPSSATFVLSQSTTSSAGGSSVSPSFLLDGSLSQPTPVGESTSGSFVLESGFWTGSSTPLVLRVQGGGSGRGSVTGDGIACALDAGLGTGDCTESILSGGSIDLVASPDAANRFGGWIGCDSTSTTTLPGDTCRVTLFTARSVTAVFTLLGRVGDFVWRDVDGDGVQAPGEPGLDGVAVTLAGGSGPDATQGTVGGLYQFVDVPPGDYEVQIDPATLPVGVWPSFDLDGLATPHTAAFTLGDGVDFDTVDFGYQPFVDLAITKLDAVDPLPGGETLVYTLTVENLGPSYATQVVVTDVLPSGTTLVASDGCAEDPVGAPTCTLGTLQAGESKSYTLEVAIDPAPPGSITNTAVATSAEADLNPADNTASQSTELDDGAPTVMLLSAAPPTADGVLSECETLFGQDTVAFDVVFDEPMFNPTGDDEPGDVTNPAGWSLVAPGTDLRFETTACGLPAGDDVSVPLEVVYDAASRTAILVPAETPLAEGLYRLFACGDGVHALVDLAGNPLDGDGDGTSGGDFRRGFRADPSNSIDNGHFDCDLGAWTITVDEPRQAEHSRDDVDDSPESGSLAFTNSTGSVDFSAEQCAVVTPGNEYRVEARLRLDTTADALVAELRCRFFGSVDCSGLEVGNPFSSAQLFGDTDSDWLQLEEELVTPAAAGSARCGVALATPTGDDFEAWFDRLVFAGDSLIFMDGFESGDVGGWSSFVP